MSILSMERQQNEKIQFDRIPSDMDRYKRDTGPYSWKEKDDLKIWGKLGKTIGFSGGSGDPVTQYENMFKNQSKSGGR